MSANVERSLKIREMSGQASSQYPVTSVQGAVTVCASSRGCRDYLEGSVDEAVTNRTTSKIHPFPSIATRKQ